MLKMKYNGNLRYKKSLIKRNIFDVIKKTGN